MKPIKTDKKLFIQLENKCLTNASPFTHETLLQRGVVCPGVALPSKAPLGVDPWEHGDPGQGGVLPVG